MVIQELDGSFNHTFKIEENKTKFESTCHSKSRRYANLKLLILIIYHPKSMTCKLFSIKLSFQ